MKTIHLLRHAKSSWADPSLSDLDRPLNGRGKRSTLLMIEPIWKAGCRFENVYCSPAKRARATIRHMSKALKGNGVYWTADESLYTFDGDDLLHWLQDLGDEMEDVMLVAHNPAITELSNLLAEDQRIENIPTCGYVQLQSSVRSWKKLNPGCAELVEFVYPKMFDIED